ncbi:hypothetical protein NLI96_g12033 [Meripilus lineatus]|uniref:F-box protein n=1 Tax=Meripilus lineatus TaxID=2056292 RepID=A0AAD5Y8K6_9APHY|nr:hypothetical protein NLI96_g12033 [Physisporinus lineatus]
MHFHHWTRWILPLEVCEKVIDESDAGGSYKERCTNFCAFALVCKSWVPRTRIHLFRDVYLDSAQQSTKFLATLSMSPGFCGYVEELTIDCSNSPNESNGWIYILLRTLPSRLTNLQRLSYNSLPTLHPTFFVFSRNFTSVKSLVLFGLNSQSFREVVQIINGFPNLLALRVDNCIWKTPGAFYKGGSHKLEVLDVFTHSFDTNKTPNGIYDVSDWVMASGSVASLQKLRLDPYYHTLQWDHFLQYGLRRLEVLYIGVHKSYNGKGSGKRTSFFRPGDRGLVLSSPGLDYLPSLESLGSLHFLFIDIHSVDSTCISSVLQGLLDCLPTSLEVIELHFPGVDSETLFEEQAMELWRTIDTTLTNSRYTSLRSVDIMWKVLPQTQPSDIPQLLSSLDQQGLFKGSFPALYKAGLLWCGDDSTDTVFSVSTACCNSKSITSLTYFEDL